VANVSPHGFWLFIDTREVFVSFESLPWFRDASIREICNVTRPSPHHLRWPDLDVDLAVESFDHPDRFRLVSKALSAHSRLNKASRKAGEPVTRKRARGG
jgi:hypothetical protein